MAKPMFNIAIVAAVLPFVVSINGEPLTAGEANEGGIRLTSPS